MPSNHAKYDTREQQEALFHELTAVAREVVAKLGNTWTCRAQVNDRSNAEILLCGPERRIIRFGYNVYDYHGKILITGKYNYGDPALGLSYPYHLMPAPVIQVTVARGAEVIYREMQRRFLPKYEQAVQEIARMVQIYTDNRNRKQGIAQRLGARAGAKPERIDGSGFGMYAAQGPYIDSCKVSDTVTLEIDGLTEEQAATLIDTLKILRGDDVHKVMAEGVLGSGYLNNGTDRG